MADSMLAASRGRLIAAASLRQRWTGLSFRPYLLLLPSLIFLVAFTYYPIAEVAWGSLYRTVYGEQVARFVGLENYGRVLADHAFRNALLNNALYAIGTVLPSLAIAFFLA